MIYIIFSLYILYAIFYDVNRFFYFHNDCLALCTNKSRYCCTLSTTNVLTKLSPYFIINCNEFHNIKDNDGESSLIQRSQRIGEGGSPILVDNVRKSLLSRKLK